MSRHADPRLLLVHVRHDEDVALAQALLSALGSAFQFFLLFADADLRDRFGESEQEHGLDPYACILGPQRFSALVSFSSPSASALSVERLLVSFFNQIGTPTIELQGSLYAEGYDPLTAWQSKRNVLHGASTLDPAVTVRVGWSGADGVGYLKSAAPNPARSFVRDDLVLVTSSLDWNLYTDKERYQFAIAVLKLADSNPEQRFVWRPRAEELGHREAAGVLDFVEEYAAPNLRLEKEEGIQELASRCRLGIAMPSTALVDLGASQKPVVVFQCAATEGLVPQGQGFRHYGDLRTLWPQVTTAPQRFLVDVGIAQLDPAHLRARIEGALTASKLPANWMALALQYIAVLREGHATRTEVEKLSSAVAQIGRRVGTMEKGLATIERTLTKVPPRLTKLLERVGVLQRSTLAYKALRLVSGRRARETDSGTDE